MFTNLFWLYTQVVIGFALYCDVDKYVQRGSLCCKPVFNCYPGYEVQPCSDMYGSEVCTRCPRDRVQPEYIDSYSEHRDCFRPKEACKSKALIPSRGREYCYPRYCKCDVTNCYVDEHCVCVKQPECPVNKTLHPVLKMCVYCPPYTFKDHVGCGPCITDILLIHSRYRHKPDNKDNELPETDRKWEIQRQKQEQHRASLKDNTTDNGTQRIRCNKCKRWKRGKGRKTMKIVKRKFKRCRRNRKRCLRRKQIMKNHTERRMLDNLRENQIPNIK